MGFLSDFKKFSRAEGIGRSAMEVIWANSAGVFSSVRAFLLAKTSSSCSTLILVISFCSLQDLGKVPYRDPENLLGKLSDLDLGCFDTEFDLDLDLKMLWILEGTGMSPSPLISANSVGLLDLTSSCLALTSSGSSITLTLETSLVSLIDLGKVPYKLNGSAGAWSVLEMSYV